MNKFCNSIIIIIIILIFGFIFKGNNIYLNESLINKKNIDKIFVINLDESKDRLKEFDKQCKRADIDYERFNAIHGAHVNRNTVSYLFNKSFLKTINNGMLGCTLSHINLWKKIADSNYKNVLIFEDDVIIPNNFWNLFNKYYDKIPKNWDIVYLGGSNIYGKLINSNILIPVKNDKRVLNVGVNIGAYAYLIKKETAIKLLREVIPIHTDFDFAVKEKFYGNNIYYFYKPIILHNNLNDSHRRTIDGISRKASKYWRFLKQSSVTIVE